MADSVVPSLSTAGIGSRFVTSDDVETAKARREEQWKAAYARLGVEPPPRQQEDPSDGRSLAEIAKQEEWEEKTKLANQFRALEEDEIMFLDSIREKEEAEDRLRKEQDGEEVQNFREAVAARTSTLTNPPPVISKESKPPITPKVAAAPTRKKGTLKGVVVKKKAKASPAETQKRPNDDDEVAPDSKRRRVSGS
ncbi:unnamed protein product [Mycena citricolor]|uniref:FAM192A/Fyv6 N-terminal domain-containing protein n=1 Tax=Mycena citricolor TaxID=2018698 RepID=A0AAD2HQR1_9AGAR|nr:unnamed protein product [Mycena citricolor]